MRIRLRLGLLLLVAGGLTVLEQSFRGGGGGGGGGGQPGSPPAARPPPPATGREAEADAHAMDGDPTGVAGPAFPEAAAVEDTAAASGPRGGCGARDRPARELSCLEPAGRQVTRLKMVPARKPTALYIGTRKILLVAKVRNQRDDMWV